MNILEELLANTIFVALNVVVILLIALSLQEITLDEES